MNYILIITLLAYVGALQLSSKFNTRPITNTAVAVLLPFIVQLTVEVIYVSGYKLPIVDNLFSLSTIILVLLQFAVALVLFYKIQSDEAIGTWMVWAIFGFIIIYLLLPFAVTSLIR